MKGGAARAETDDAELVSIHLRGLGRRFGTREALSGIDLEVVGAQMVGVVGPDGAGKTTLLRILAGLLELEAEEATVLGYDLREDVRHYKSHVGYVPQAFSLYRDLTIAENLSFTARLHRLSDADFRSRRDDLLERTGLAPFADRLAGNLSGGMKQKLAVANALLPHPDLLILDEPTAGVDVVARREIFDILTGLEGSILIVVSTSYLEEAALCDRLVYLRGGHLVAEGSPKELEAATGTEPYRAWTDDGETVKIAARALPYVDSARDCGRFVRIEVESRRSPGAEAVCRDLYAITGGAPSAQAPAAAAEPGRGLVALAERAPADLESTLLALARRAGVR